MTPHPLERSRIFSERTLLNMRQRHDRAIRKRAGDGPLVALAIAVLVLIAVVTVLLVTIAVVRPV